MRTRTLAATAVLLAAATWPASTHAQAVEESLAKSKSVTMLVGSGAGGGYDTYARIFARHMARYIPGNPTIIAKNMPAAAGLAAANTLYTTADKDGSTIAAFTNGSAMEPLFGNASARYDAQKFNWLGSIGKLQNVCATWHQSSIKTIAAARAREVIVAAAGATSNTAIVPRTLNALIDTKFKVIAGYDTGAGLTLSIERGEAEGICGLSWSTMKASRPHWIRDKLLNRHRPDGPAKASRPARSAERARPRHRRREQARSGTDPDPAGGGSSLRGAPGVPPDRACRPATRLRRHARRCGISSDAAKAQLEIEPLTGRRSIDSWPRPTAPRSRSCRKAAALVEPSTRAP